MTTVDFIMRATRAAAMRGTPVWDSRMNAYWRAFARRARREESAKGPYGEASPALICLSSRVIDITAH